MNKILDQLNELGAMFDCDDTRNFNEYMLLVEEVWEQHGGWSKCKKFLAKTEKLETYIVPFSRNGNDYVLRLKIYDDYVWDLFTKEGWRKHNMEAEDVLIKFNSRSNIVIEDTRGSAYHTYRSYTVDPIGSGGGNSVEEAARSLVESVRAEADAMEKAINEKYPDSIQSAKPCPFCGGPANEDDYYNDGWDAEREEEVTSHFYLIRCNTCKFIFEESDEMGPLEIREKWNKRA